MSLDGLWDRCRRNLTLTLLYQVACGELVLLLIIQLQVTETTDDIKPGVMVLLRTGTEWQMLKLSLNQNQRRQ